MNELLLKNGDGICTDLNIGDEVVLHMNPPECISVTGEIKAITFDPAIDKSKDTLGFNMFFDEYLDREDDGCGDRCEPFAS